MGQEAPETERPRFDRGHSKSVVSIEHSVQSQYRKSDNSCQVTWGDYLCIFSPLEVLLTRLRTWENGPDGTRTRICDLDRVLCSHYTTGPILI